MTLTRKARNPSWISASNENRFLSFLVVLEEGVGFSLW
jgi:hypothetical protein